MWGGAVQAQPQFTIDHLKLYIQFLLLDIAVQAAKFGVKLYSSKA